LWSFTEGRIADVVYARNGHAVARLTGSDGNVVEWESGCKDVRPSFVSTNLVAVLGCNRFDVITVAGDIVFGGELVGKTGYVASASQTASRFAVVQPFFRPGDPPTLCTERISVFDVNQRKTVFMTDVSDFTGATAGQASGLALSPSGLYLAIKSASIVRMFALPPTS
jgi:hypothetical protein